MTDLWVRDRFMLQVNSVGETFASRVLDMAVVHAIVVFGCEKVPSINGMIVPRAAIVGLLVYLRRASHWSEWHLVVIERSDEMRVCRNGGCCILLSEQIESDLCLWKEAVP